MVDPEMPEVRAELERAEGEAQQPLRRRGYNTRAVGGLTLLFAIAVVAVIVFAYFT